MENLVALNSGLPSTAMIFQYEMYGTPRVGLEVILGSSREENNSWNCLRHRSVHNDEEEAWCFYNANVATVYNDFWKSHVEQCARVDTAWHRFNRDCRNVCLYRPGAGMQRYQYRCKWNIIKCLFAYTTYLHWNAKNKDTKKSIRRRNCSKTFDYEI